MFKRLMRSPILQAALGALVALWMVFVKYTTRWTVFHEERIDPFIKSGDNFIALTFHSRFLLLNAAWSRKYGSPYVLISRSRDGNLIAWACRWLGVKTVRGSSRNSEKSGGKGGVEAGLSAVSVLGQGGCLVITPDGPRGPRQRVSPGAFRLSRLTRVPIISCTLSVSHRKVFGSWDKFVLPLPFGRGEIHWGTVQSIEPGASDEQLETLRLGMETEMNTLLSAADRSLGHDPIEPAQ